MGKTKCIVCGNLYNGCSLCNEHAGMSWKTYCDKPSCFQIYQILLNYRMNVYNAEDAKERLKKIPYKKNELLPEVQGGISRIYKAAKEMNLSAKTD